LPLHDLANELIDAANAAGGSDNVTVVLIRIVGR
jgi:serine/threonine protein phosphatase PrpC